jgi:hypothetical protein
MLKSTWNKVRWLAITLGSAAISFLATLALLLIISPNSSFSKAPIPEAIAIAISLSLSIWLGRIFRENVRVEAPADQAPIQLGALSPVASHGLFAFLDSMIMREKISIRLD